MKKKKYLTLIAVNGSLVTAGSRRRRPMHNKQVFGRKAHALGTNGIDNALPSGLRYTFPLLPLEDCAKGFSDGLGHIGRSIPNTENFTKRLHGDYLSLDDLSRQAMITGPVTGCHLMRKIGGMGRRVTRSKFKTDFCARLKAARIVAGLDQAEVAAKLGIPANTWGTYETRTLLPHELIEPVCEILGIDADYLFKGKKTAIKAA